MDRWTERQADRQTGRYRSHTKHPAIGIMKRAELLLRDTTATQKKLVT